jgi:hypothetical protein
LAGNVIVDDDIGLVTSLAYTITDARVAISKNARRQNGNEPMMACHGSIMRVRGNILPARHMLQTPRIISRLGKLTSAACPNFQEDGEIESSPETPELLPKKACPRAR